MSENHKEESGNPVFDGGAECKSARPSARARGPILSRTDEAWLKEKEKSGELDVVVRDIDRATAKRVLVDGLSRRGYRLNIPDHVDMFELEDNVEQLKKIFNEVLHGRNAAVFQGLVIDPLMGRPKRSVEDLAEQFGVTPRKIYKITERCKLRIARAPAKQHQTGSVEAGTWKVDPSMPHRPQWPARPGADRKELDPSVPFQRQMPVGFYRAIEPGVWWCFGPCFDGIVFLRPKINLFS